MLFNPLLDPALFGWLLNRRRHWRTSPTGDSKDESAYRHADCCKDARDRYPLFAEESSNSLSQRLVFMEEPPDGLTNSVDLRPESCSIRGEGFEPRLPFKLDVGELAFKLLHSVSNILLNFGVVRFGQFSAFPGQVLFDRISGRRRRFASRGC